MIYEPPTFCHIYFFSEVEASFSVLLYVVFDGQPQTLKVGFVTNICVKLFFFFFFTSASHLLVKCPIIRFNVKNFVQTFMFWL